jgi:structural maintenance of chromosome 4
LGFHYKLLFLLRAKMEKDPSPQMVTETEGPQSRLMITKMVLENFKSYAGKREIGPFHKCFSSVVGPNGSGKSNVIDAMLFVFGKKASKLRLNNVRLYVYLCYSAHGLTTCRFLIGCGAHTRFRELP